MNGEVNQIILRNLSIEIQTKEKIRTTNKKSVNTALISQLKPKKVDEAMKANHCVKVMQEEIDQ